MLPPFPPFRISLGAVRRDVRSAKAVIGVRFLPLPAPVKGLGSEAAGLLTLPPLIHFFFGQQGGAGFFTFVDYQVVDCRPVKRRYRFIFPQDLL